jgi:hypothetical protein
MQLDVFVCLAISYKGTTVLSLAKCSCYFAKFSVQLDLFVCLAISYKGNTVLSFAKYLKDCPKLYPVCYGGGAE